MTIKGIEEKVEGLQKRGKTYKQKDSKTARRKGIKKKMTVYVDEKLIDVLQVYSFQHRKKISHTVEELIETHLKDKVSKALLRG